MTIGRQFTPHCNRRASERCVDITCVECARQQHIVGCSVVHRHLGQAPRRDSRCERLVIDDQLFGCVLGQVTIGSHDRRHWFAGKTDLVSCQRRLVGLDITRQGRQGPQGDVESWRRGGEHIDPGRQLTEIDVGDRRVPITAAQEGHVAHSWQLQVRDETAAAGQEPSVFFAPGRRCRIVMQSAHLRPSSIRRLRQSPGP